MIFHLHTEVFYVSVCLCANARRSLVRNRIYVRVPHHWQQMAERDEEKKKKIFKRWVMATVNGEKEKYFLIINPMFRACKKKIRHVHIQIAHRVSSTTLSLAKFGVFVGFFFLFSRSPFATIYLLWYFLVNVRVVSYVNWIICDIACLSSTRLNYGLPYEPFGPQKCDMNVVEIKTCDFLLSSYSQSLSASTPEQCTLRILMSAFRILNLLSLLVTYPWFRLVF